MRLFVANEGTEEKQVRSRHKGKSKAFPNIIAHIISHYAPIHNWNKLWIHGNIKFSNKELDTNRGKTNFCTLKTMGRVGETAKPSEVTTREEKFKAILFLIRTDKSRYGQLFEDIRKADL